MKVILINSLNRNIKIFKKHYKDLNKKFIKY